MKMFRLTHGIMLMLAQLQEMLRNKHQVHGNMLTEIYPTLEGFYTTIIKNTMRLLREE